MSDVNVTPEQIHEMASKFKDYMRDDLGEKEAAVGCLAVDCFAALLVKLSLCEKHFEKIANNLEAQTEIMQRSAGMY